MALRPRFALLRDQRLSRAAHLCELGLKDLVESLADDKGAVTKVVVQFEGELHLAIVPFAILGTTSFLVLCCGILHREIELSRGIKGKALQFHFWQPTGGKKCPQAEQNRSFGSGPSTSYLDYWEYDLDSSK